MNVDVSRKVIVITGAAQGFGQALALGLAREGARVVVLARDHARAQADVGVAVRELTPRPAGSFTEYVAC
jgi:NAD(P)-dependent dehydrogenase (short-subunit alcohol dehydrogenase family)